MSLLMLILLATLPPVPTPEQDSVCAASRECFPAFLTSHLQVDQTRENFVFQILQPLRTADHDGDGLDAGDIDLARQKISARERSQRLQAVLMYDLDGDLRVTKDEMRRALPVNTFSDQQISRLLEDYDVNGDGVIDAHEVVAKPAPSAPSNSYEVTPLLQLMTLNSNGRLTARALQTIAERVFDAFDRDRNGILSAAELAGVRSR